MKLTLFKLLLIFFLFNSAYSKPQRFALLIGVDYQGTLNLEYTDNDVLYLGDILKKNFGFTTEAIKTKTETSKKNIIDELEKLKNRKEKYDQLIIFFSGHGIQDPNSSEIGYLLPSDGDTTSLLATSIDMSIIQNLSKTIKAHQILFILDACYSGIISSYETKDISGKYDNSRTLFKARQIITAGNSNEQARIYPSKKMSIYTYFLIKGLSKEKNILIADKDHNDVISLWELQSYVQSKVSKTTKNAQNPKLYNYTEDEGIFLFKPIQPTIKPNKEIENETYITKDGKILGETGKIQLTSYLNGTVYIDDDSVGHINTGEIREYYNRKVGEHSIEVKSKSKTVKEIFKLEKGKTYMVVIDPVLSDIFVSRNKNNNQLTGALRLFLKDIGGRVYINDTFVGEYKSGENILIKNLPIGKAICTIKSQNQKLSKEVLIEADKTLQSNISGGFRRFKGFRGFKTW